MKKVFVTAIAILVIFLGIGINSADAIPTLTLDDGINPAVTIVDNLVGDLNSAAGAITYIGSLGMFDLNVSSAVTKPIAGSATSPLLDLISQTITGLCPDNDCGLLTVTFEEDWFGPLAVNGFTSALSGTMFGTGTIAVQTFVNNTLLASLGPLGGSAFSDSVYTPNSPDTPFSLKVVAIIDQGSNTTSSLDAGITVPEPGTLMLFGSGLVGLFYVRRKKVFNK